MHVWGLAKQRASKYHMILTPQAYFYLKSHPLFPDFINLESILTVLEIREPSTPQAKTQRWQTKFNLYIWSQ